jgi:putative Mn2+ efflux pump MntP
MDACAVAMTDGMTNPKMPFWRTLLIGFTFGFFQFLMPIIGYYATRLIADNFVGIFEKASAWISFGLLAFLGGKMLFESIKELLSKKKLEGEEVPPVSQEKLDEAAKNMQVTDGAACPLGGCKDDNCPVVAPEKFSVWKLLMQAVATSIDALAVGVTLCSAEAQKGLALGAWGATGIIGAVTFVLAFSAIYIGKAIGNKLADKAGILGGVVLLGIGIKILIEGLLG